MISTAMDTEWLQNLEERLREQAEATRATNELITQLFSMMRSRNIDDHIATPPSLSVSLPSLSHPSQPGSVLHSSQIKPANPDNFDGDRSKGRAFLTSCELYLSLTGADFPDEQACIHWALLFFKSGHAAMFAECTVRQEMRTGVMAFADRTDFTSEFMSTFCPENEATSELMRLESDHYFQGQQHVEAYIDEFRDFVNMSGYTDPIAIVLEFLPRPECNDTVMLHINLTSELLTMRQSSLRYSIYVASAVSAVLDVAAVFTVSTTTVSTATAVVSVYSASASDRSLHLVSSVRPWSYHPMAPFPQSVTNT
jgi:hypothetical protein